MTVVGDCWGGFSGQSLASGFPIPHMSSQVSGTSSCDGSVLVITAMVFIFDWGWLHKDSTYVCKYLLYACMSIYICIYIYMFYMYIDYIYIYIYVYVYWIHIRMFSCSYIGKLWYIHIFTSKFIFAYLHRFLYPQWEKKHPHVTPPWISKHLVEA